MLTWNGFSGIRAYNQTLQNDLRDLERYLKGLEERLASVIAGEGLNTIINRTGDPTLARHAWTHPHDGTDPITVYDFIWDEAHTFAPVRDFTPVTITGFLSQTTDLFTIQGNDGTDYFTVDFEGKAGIHSDPDAMLVVQGAGGGFVQYSDSVVTAIPSLVWWYAGDEFVTTSGSNVTAWAPKFANSLYGTVSQFTANTVVNSVTAVTDAGGYHGVRFGASSALLTSVNFFNSAGDFTLVMVTAPWSASAPTMNILKKSGVAGGNFVSGITWNIFPTARSIYFPTSAGTNSYYTGTTSLSGTYAAHQQVMDLLFTGRYVSGAAQNGLMVYNNTSYAVAPVGVQSGGTGTEASSIQADGFGWGTSSGGAATQDYAIFEILYFDRRLTTDEIDTIEAYLRGKYQNGFGVSSATYDLTRWKNSSGTTLSRVDEQGWLGIAVDPTSPVHVVQADSTTPSVLVVKPASASSARPQLRLAYDSSNYSDFTEWQNETAFSGVGSYYETNLYSYFLEGDPAGGAWLTIQAGPFSGFTVSDNTNMRKSLILNAAGSSALEFTHTSAPNASAFSGQYLRAMTGTMNLIAPGSTYDPGGLSARPDVRVAFGQYNSGDPTSPTIYAMVGGPNCEYDQGGAGLYNVSGGVGYNVLDTRGSNANITWGGVHTFSAMPVFNAGINLGTSGLIQSNRSDTGAGSYMTRLKENSSYLYTVADDRYYLLVEDTSGNDVFYLTTAGNIVLGGGGFVTGGAGVSQLATYGNFISKGWTITDGSTKYGMGMNATIDANTTAGSSAVGAQFIIQGGSSAVNMNTMQGATFDVYGYPVGTTLTMLRGAKITTNASQSGASTKTITSVEGLNISHAASGTNNVITNLRGIKIENAGALAAGSSIAYQIGVEIDESTRGTSGNFGIAMNQSATDYKAITFRDSNTWINSRNSGELDLNASSEIQLRVVGAAHLTVTTNLLTIKDELNIVFNTTTGTKIGTATGQKFAFWNKTPIIQPAGANQAALTNSTGGTYDGTLAAVGNTSTGDQSGVLNNNFTDIHTLLDEIRTALVNTGIIKGAA